jgi:hypothetical protein
LAKKQDKVHARRVRKMEKMDRWLEGCHDAGLPLRRKCPGSLERIGCVIARATKGGRPVAANNFIARTGGLFDPKTGISR